MADTFISYAREDVEFVRRLVEALQASGRDVWVDWAGIIPADQWMSSVRDAIDSSDVFVFVISPSSVASSVCATELSLATQQGKRIVPVVWQDPPAAELPAELGAIAQLNWTFLRQSDDFDAGLALLLQALQVDIELARIQTRVLTRARAWESGGRRTSPLLRGEELRQAEAWLARAASGAEPKPTDLQSSFIAASRHAWNRRQRRSVTISLAVAVMAVSLSLVAVIQRNHAREAQRLALSGQLTAQSGAHLEDDPQLSVILAGRALAVHRSDAAQLAGVRARDASAVTQILHGPGRDVMAVDYSPDGTQLAAADLDGVITVWRLADAKAVQSLSANHRGVRDLHFSADGHQLVAAGLDGSARLWDLASGHVVRVFEASSAALSRAVFSPDGGRLLTAAADGSARIWDVSTGAVVAEISDPAPVVGAAFSHDGSLVATAGYGGRIAVWDGTNGRLVRDLATKGIGVAAVGFSPDDTRLASTGQDGTVRFWDVASGRQRGFATATGPQLALAYSPDGTLVATSGLDQAVNIWNADLEPEQSSITNPRTLPVHRLRGHRGIVQGLAFSPDGHSIASGSSDATARIWSTGRAPGGAAQLIDADIAPSSYPVTLTALAPSPDGAHVAIGDAQGSLRLVAVSTGAKIFGVTDGTYIADLTISPDGRLLVVASNAATTVRDAADGRVLKTLALPVPGGTTMVRFNDDGSTLATADLDGHVRLWDVATAAVTRDLDLVNGEASAVAFAHAEPYLATGTQGGRVTIWNTTTGASVGQLPTLLPRVNDLVYTPDDAVLVEASDDPRAYVWDAHQRTLLRTLRGKTGAVLSLAVSGDGQSVVAGGDDDTARVWDLASGRTLRILDGSTNAVTKVAYRVELGSKEETILTASGDGRVARWSACEWCRDAGLLGKQLDGATVRCLTADERRELLGETPSALKDEPCAA